MDLIKAFEHLGNNLKADEVRQFIELLATLPQEDLDLYKSNFSVFDGISPGVEETDGGLLVVAENVIFIGRAGPSAYIVIGVGNRSYAFSTLATCPQLSFIDAFDNREEAVACAVTAACSTPDDEDHTWRYYVDHTSSIPEMKN